MDLLGTIRRKIISYACQQEPSYVFKIVTIRILRYILEGVVFKWQDLLEPPTQRFYIFENMAKDPPQYEKDKLRRKNMLTDNRVRVNESKSNSPDYVIHELARELIFTYAMSMLARYDILKWKDLMDGKQDNIMWNIEGYLKSTQSFFPNLIFNEIHGTRYFFYPESRSAPDEPTF
jgi:YaaC-like protein